MIKPIFKKRCIICKDEFTPDPRVGDRQKVCSKLACKLQRKKLAQQHWCARNPDYFKSRYPLLKEQILANQRKSPRKQPVSPPTIQDKIIRWLQSMLKATRQLATIQDELTSKITGANSTHCRTIQDELIHFITCG